MTAFCVWYVYVYFTVSVCGAFINMPLFEHARLCLKLSLRPITYTNVRVNKSPICKNKGCYYWQNNNKHTLFSQKNKDKSNEVTWGFLNIISGGCSIRFTPAFSTPAIYSCFFHSCILHRCCLLHFPPLQFCPYRIIYSRIFRRPQRN